MAGPRTMRAAAGLPRTWNTETLEILAEAMMSGGGPDVGPEARNAFLEWIAEVDREFAPGGSLDGADLSATLYPRGLERLH